MGDGARLLADLRAPRGQHPRGEVAKHRAVELVGARLRHRVDHASRGAAILGQVAAADDIDLANELHAQRGAVDAKARVIHRHAIDDVLVLRRGRAVDGHPVGVAVGARSQLRQRLEGARRRPLAAGGHDGDVAQEGLADVHPRGGGADVHGRGPGHYVDGPLERLGQQLHVDAHRVVQPHVDVRAGQGRVALAGEVQGVHPRGQLGDAVLTGLVGDHRLLSLERGRGRRHHHVHHRLPGRGVHHLAQQHRGALRQGHIAYQAQGEHQQARGGNPSFCHGTCVAREGEGLLHRALLGMGSKASGSARIKELIAPLSLKFGKIGLAIPCARMGRGPPPLQWLRVHAESIDDD
jgi:hypothetical protein